MVQHIATIKSIGSRLLKPGHTTYITAKCSMDVPKTGYTSVSVETSQALAGNRMLAVGYVTSPSRKNEVAVAIYNYGAEDFPILDGAELGSITITY